MSSSPPRPAPFQARALVAVAVVVALVLRIAEALESSLWLDELHTLAHASLPTVAAVAENVAKEVHSPLFFVVVHWFGGWEQGAWLRAIPVLASLLVFVPLVRFARGVPASLGLAAWLLACLPYQVHWATELRPYAFLAVFAAGAADAAFRESGSRWGRIGLFCACVLGGMLTHRLMALAVFAIGATRLVVRSRAMLSLWALIAAGAAGVAPSLPWLIGFAQQATTDRFGFQESHGGFVLRTALLKEAAVLPTRLFAPFLGSLGGAWALLAQGASAVFFVALLVALIAFWRNRERQRWPAPLRALAWFAALDFVLVAGLSFYTWDRLPLQYYATMAWTLPVLVAALVVGCGPRWRPALTLALAASALALGIAQAGGRGMEDVRGAVATVRRIGGELERPLYTALLSQPTLFDDTLPYKAYAPELDAREPRDVPHPDQPAGRRPLVVLRRGNIPLDHPGWKPLLEGRQVAREVHVDRYLTVFVLEPAN